MLNRIMSNPYTLESPVGPVILSRRRRIHIEQRPGFFVATLLRMTGFSLMDAMSRKV